MVNARAPHSFRSPLAQKLLMHVNADLVRDRIIVYLTETNMIIRYIPAVQDQTMIHSNIQPFS